jgi:C1A family cysteine protease
VKRLGYIPDTVDARDHRIAKLGLSAAVPSSASLRKYVVEVLDQGDTSKCVAHAFAQALRIADKIAGVPSPQLSSRDFLYFNALAYDGGGFVDQGTQLRSCARGLTKFGRPPEVVCPFKHDPLVARPSWDAYRQGYDHKGPSAYLRVTGLDEIKQAIAANKPVVGGASVGNSIFDASASGIYDPSPTEPSIGGHALTVCGYDAQSFLLCNSWGTSFADGGFFRVSPRFMASFTDTWAIHQ